MAIALLTLALLGTLALAATSLLGYQVHAGLVPLKVHFLAALGATTLLVMAHSFILFFLIATGASMKEIEKERGWGDSFRRRTIGLKGRVFPIATLTLALVMANFILGAAVHTRALPPAVHALLALATLAASILTLYREYRVLGDNNRLIAEAGMRQKSPSPP